MKNRKLPLTALKAEATRLPVSIVWTPRGMIVNGKIPAERFEALAKMGNFRSDAVICPGIARVLGVDWVFAASSKQADIWTEEINDALDAMAKAHNWTPLMRWLHGVDTGISSLTMARRCFPGCWPPDGYYRDAIPEDADDFGRCYRLLRAVPELRESFQEKMRQPEVWLTDEKEQRLRARWMRVLDQWAELEALYEAKDYEPLRERLSAASRAEPAEVTPREG